MSYSFKCKTSLSCHWVESLSIKVIDDDFVFKLSERNICFIFYKNRREAYSYSADLITILGIFPNGNTWDRRSHLMLNQMIHVVVSLHLRYFFFFVFLHTSVYSWINLYLFWLTLHVTHAHTCTLFCDLPSLHWLLFSQMIIYSWHTTKLMNLHTNTHKIIEMSLNQVKDTDNWSDHDCLNLHEIKQKIKKKFIYFYK